MESNFIDQDDQRKDNQNISSTDWDAIIREYKVQRRVTKVLAYLSLSLSLSLISLSHSLSHFSLTPNLSLPPSISLSSISPSSSFSLFLPDTVGLYIYMYIYIYIYTHYICLSDFLKNEDQV